jgi:hypothetical protein
MFRAQQNAFDDVVGKSNIPGLDSELQELHSIRLQSCC